MKHARCLVLDQMNACINKNALIIISQFDQK